MLVNVCQSIYAAYLAVEFIVLASVFLPYLITSSVLQLLYSVAVDFIPGLKCGIRGKHIFLTGCDTGFGFSVTLGLAELGVNVHANCYTKEGAENLKWASTGSVKTYVFDVTDERAVLECRKQVENSLGTQSLWGILNNAGVGSYGFIEGSSMEEFRKVLELNTVATVSVCKHFLPLLRKDLKNPGRIINIASILGRLGAASIGPYCASKFAIEGFSDSLRRELIPFGVTVTIIEPGFFKTAMVVSGRTKASSDFQKMPESLQRLYKKFFEKYVLMMLGIIEVAGGNPSWVVSEILRNFQSKWPLDRVLIGWDALVLIPALTLAPTRISDFLYQLIIPKY
jgi:NAD(P)-dependent dehydrogenase (short-subunit alcohol dehydrogenase family)